MTYYKLDSYVNDFSGIIKNEKKFNKNFYEYEQESGIQIATVFIKHRNGRALKDIALEIFNKNGIGKKQTNSGLLLIVVTDEKKIRIMTGKGMEIEFPNSLAKDIIQNELRGLLNSGRYEQLLKSWYELSTKKRRTKNIYKEFKRQGIISEQKNTQKKKKYTFDILKFFMYFLLFIILLFYFLSIYYGIFCTIMISSIIFGILFLYPILSSHYKIIEKKKYYSFFFLILFTIISIGFSYKTSYYFNNGNIDFSCESSGSSSYDSDSSWGSDSSYDSDYDSYDSYDSDWGGGSSNGGGWGD